MSDDSINNLRKEIMEKIDNLTKSMSEVQVTLAGLPEKIFEKADERYANKNVEKAVYIAIGVLCGTAIILAWSILSKTPVQLQL